MLICHLLVSPPLLTQVVLQVYHASEIPFVYGNPSDASASASFLSDVMLDYWISFATSLNPNDGLGNKRQ